MAGAAGERVRGGWTVVGGGGGGNGEVGVWGEMMGGGVGGCGVAAGEGCYC